MKKTLGGLIIGAMLALPGAAFAQSYMPVFGANVAYGIGGNNPYAGNCNYQDDCRFTYAQPTYQLYWCNGIQQYFPCQEPQYYYGTYYTPPPQRYYTTQYYYYLPQPYYYTSSYSYNSYNYGYGGYYGW